MNRKMLMNLAVSGFVLSVATGCTGRDHPVTRPAAGSINVNSSLKTVAPASAAATVSVLFPAPDEPGTIITLPPDAMAAA